MIIDHQKALSTAHRYLNTSAPLTRLGWGVDGFVYLSPDAQSVVKVHHDAQAPGYATELEAYRRLRQLRIRQLHGLNIPRLLGHDDTNGVILMDFVSPPFLLDFAGVRFQPPDFPEGWQAPVEEKFGPNAWIAYLVYESLTKHGIYYTDFRPSNLKLDGYPGLEPWPAEDDES